MKEIGIGILGMGVVGSGLVNALNAKHERLKKHLDKEIKIKGVLVRNKEKDRGLNLDKHILTTSVDEILNNEDIAIVIELIGGTDDAYDYIKRALNSGKHVVTANKALMARYGSVLIELAKKNKVHLRYEASVAGGIPILNTIRENMLGNRIERLYGIVNGTSNFILTQMAENKVDYHIALSKAQELGFAEANPKADVSGEDAANKLCILVRESFDYVVEPKYINYQGIENVSCCDIAYGEKIGARIKLIASAIKKDSYLDLEVAPTYIKENHFLANVSNNYNAVVINGEEVGDLIFYGKGAGSLPTGTAVLNDIVSIVRNQYNAKTSSNLISEEMNLNNKKNLKEYVLRIDIDEDSNINEIEKRFNDNRVFLNNEFLFDSEDERSVMYTTEMTTSRDLELGIMALNEISGIKGTHYFNYSHTSV